MTQTISATAGTDSLLRLLQNDGMVSAQGSMTPLPGGVSSDIYRVDDGGRSFVVKRALTQLRVRDKWAADVSRNVTERHYLEYVATLLPQCVPAILGHGEAYFTMEYLEAGYSNWKTRLMQGHPSRQHAATAGIILGTIHARSRGNRAIAARFDCMSNFSQLRVEPYLITAARRVTKVSRQIGAEAQRLLTTTECLIHGDFSPKNILVGEDRFAILDCEVACYGDPTFDVAFLISHLLLKAVYWGSRSGSSRIMIEHFLASYMRARRFEASDANEMKSRVSRLLPMLLLARVDGKSPVEYLNRMQQAFVRAFSVDAIRAAPAPALAILCQQWFESFRTMRVR